MNVRNTMYVDGGQLVGGLYQGLGTPYHTERKRLKERVNIISTNLFTIFAGAHLAHPPGRPQATASDGG